MTPQVLDIAADFPPKLQFLFKPSAYKVAYGGRGGTKSWGFARALLILGTQRQLRVLCARETQKSIRDSVHQLLVTQINDLGLEAFYRVEKSAIYGLNGTTILFAGLKHNVDNLKSMEAISVCWVEEAQGVSKSSWDKLIPTLFRIPDCELWISFNPDLESDNTYQRFVVDPPPGAVVQKLTWRDNPWFPEGLRREMEDARRRNVDEYNHIWEGVCINTLANAIYANELRLVDTENRIRRVPYDPSKPVDTAWDLGFGDMVSIWMFQSFPMEFRIIDYEEGQREPIHYYLAELQKRPYMWGTDYLPWDGGVKALGTGKSIEDLMRAAGRRVRSMRQLPIADGINAARTIFPLCYFDEARCAEGLRHLRCYRYGEMKTIEGPTREPLHDLHCFVPDTLVLTRHGTHRIMDLPENGEVLTPCGWKAYEAPRITRRNAQLVEVRFKDGTTVRCTPDHLFLTDSGWKSADSLRPDTLIQSSLTRSRSISMAACTVYGRVSPIFREGAKEFIEMFGRAHSALFPKVAISTIGTPILQTTWSPIWSACPRESTSLFRGIFPKLTPRRTNISVLLRGNEQVSGTNRRKDDCGIGDRPTNLSSGGNASANPESVCIAAWRSWPLFERLSPRNSAMKCAKQPPTESAREHSPSQQGRTVGRIGIAKIALANIAAKSLAALFARADSRRSSAPRYAGVPLRIEIVQPLTERADTCCIHVPDVECFSLANGAIVHNSHAADGFRTLAVSIRQPQKEREKQKQQYQHTSPWS